MLLLTTFSTVYSGFTVTGIPAEAYKRGFVSLRWIGATLVIVAGMLLLYPRLRRLAVERGYTSPNDFIRDRYRTVRLRLLCAACGCVPMLIYITAQMLAFSAMVDGIAYGILPKWASMLMFCVIILVLEMLGGMNSVVLTDAVQSSVMLCAFLVVPFLLGLQYGFLPEIAPADCPSLTYVMPNASSQWLAPETCMESGHAACVPAGCIAAVRPEFYDFPSRSTLSDICFFLLNMLAAPLQPHMVQRAYIASNDRDLRLVMGAMLLAPFVAQTPGILIGLTKSAYNPTWPLATQASTAFSAVTDQLLQTGPVQYFVVAVMLCSTLAAIMSTADSALMGASSIVSIDVFKGILFPPASHTATVRAGMASSFFFCTTAFLLGLALSVQQMGAIIVFQNGMLMQMLPAFGLGLFCSVHELAITGGIISGLFSLLVMVLAGNPLEGHVPVINVSVFLNFGVVALVQAGVCMCSSRRHSKDAENEVVVEDHQFGKQLTVSNIQEVMKSSHEPNIIALGVMLALALLSAPWYGTPGQKEPMIAGLPRWGFIQCITFVVIFGVGLLATWRWRPPAPEELQFEDITASAATARQSPTAESAVPSSSVTV
eukprot:TRINITY_DN29943_c0_g1_i1.p1 TRINITY_DN29943_c0_g1~~TRINITY_DN29943_c0_g1_i1.p1  ORF type:complete len:680 (+),score=114.29 TRINITY_DN29943_c0_g1_i1:243-2042(+)